MKNILVVSITKFYGGGENFILTHLTPIKEFNFSYLINSNTLFEKLPSDSKKHTVESDNFFCTVKQIKKIARQDSIEVIILNGGRSLFFAPFIHCCSTTVLQIRHTLNECIPLSYRFFYAALLNLAMCFADKTVHVSNASKKEQWFNKKNAVVIHNGVAKKIRKKEISKNGGLNFVYIGRMVESKGIGRLIDIFNRLDKKRCQLYLVGDGEIDSSFPHNDNVHFEGFTFDLEKYYLSADFFISLTKQENCSLSIIDALSYGVPVLTTDVGGNPEIVKSGFNGFILPKNEEDIVNFIQNTIQNIDKTEYKKLCDNALLSFERDFDIENKKSVYKSLLESL